MSVHRDQPGGRAAAHAVLPPPLCPGAGRDPARRAARPFLAGAGEALKPLGDGFIKLVKMIIAPVIFLTVVTGIAGMRELGSVGRVAGQGVRLFPVLLDAGADRRPDRRQCRRSRARA